MRFVALFLVAACTATAGSTSVTVETTRVPTTAATEHPALFGPAGNGLIAYSYAGDIYVGDPATGTSEAIVGGPESDVNAIFSPDGRRIAFVRGDPYGDSSLVVVRADGSDERVVVPRGFSNQGVGPFAWTPDSLSLVVGHDSKPTAYHDGQLSLIDASGLAEPRLLTPPLPAQIGAQPFNASAQVAPMFRPPNGDLILSAERDKFEVWDGDLQNATQLAPSFFEAKEHYWVGGPTWSPDGALIMFGLDLVDSANQYIGSEGLLVMNADGGDIRHIGEGGANPLWSPDSSKIAFERSGTDPGETTAVIVILDLGSGGERVLEATSAEQKRGSDFHTITWNTFHEWFYEAWSWAPDGRSLLILDSHRTRPLVVDVETDQATELPWEADSAPSWQPVATG